MAPIKTTLPALAALIGASIAAPVIEARALQPCGNAYYDPSQYTCYNQNGGLCPVINGEPTLLCGNACYSSHMYSCTNGVLQQLPPQDSYFTLTASNPTAPFNGKTIEASGLHFFIGRGAGSYCPSPPVPAGACPPGNTTILGVGYLNTMVPGGQNTYWQKDGALAFTQAHSAATYNLTAYSPTVYEDGGYFGPNGEDLVACPVSGSSGVWQVFARLVGLQFASDCTGFYAIAHDSPAGSFGAWQYV